MKLKVFTAFSGYDSQCIALDRLHQHNKDFEYELVGWSEIDKFAIQAHNAVYPQWAERNYGDISKIDWAQVPDFDLFTYSSPCQDFSQAGKQAGGTEGSGTRSSLLWECRRAILAKRPKYLLMENVAALVSSKFIRLFNAWQLELESYGYRNFAKVLNAKDYGVPQNRERIFMVSVLDETARYDFPAPMPLTIRLKDVLETEVEERYYLSEQQINMFNAHAERHGGVGHGFGWNPTEGDVVANALLACSQNRPSGNYIKEVGMINKGLSGKVYDEDGLSPTITAGEGVKYNTKILQRGHGFNKGSVLDICPTITSNSFECNNHVLERVDGENGYPTWQTDKGVKIKKVFREKITPIIPQIPYGYRIRKLTERECFRLMDMPEEYIDRIQSAGISRSQQYKMAGNSIVVACLYYIFDKLFIHTTPTELTLF